MHWGLRLFFVLYYPEQAGSSPQAYRCPFINNIKALSDAILNLTEAPPHALVPTLSVHLCAAKTDWRTLDSSHMANKANVLATWPLTEKVCQPNLTASFLMDADFQYNGWIQLLN